MIPDYAEERTRIGDDPEELKDEVSPDVITQEYFDASLTSLGNRENPFYLTSLFWDCNCLDDYIHPKHITHCDACNSDADTQPDSRANEVIDAFPNLHLKKSWLSDSWGDQPKRIMELINQYITLANSQNKIHKEPAITINGTRLNDAQAMALRVAIGNFLIDLNSPESGWLEAEHIEHGTLYKTRLREIEKMIHRKENS